MANVKNFGLVGVASDVQFGKSGPRLINAAGTFKFRDAADAAFANVQVANLTADALKGTTESTLVTVDASGQLKLDATIASLATDAEVAIIKTALEAADTALDGRLDTAEQDIIDLKAADVALDGRLDILEGKTSVDTAALQTEIDAIETAVGLNTDGTLTAIVGNYLNVDGDAATTAATLKAAVEKLDAAIKARADAIAAEVTRATGEEADIRSDFAAADSALQTSLQNQIDAAIAGITWENPVNVMYADITVEAVETAIAAMADGARVYDAATNSIYTVTGGVAGDAEVMVQGAAFFDRTTTVPYVFNGTDMVQFNGAAGLTAGLGLAMDGNTMNLDLASTGGLKFYPDASNPNNTVGLKLDGTTLVVGTDGLKIADATFTQIATDIATAKTAAIADAKTYTDGRETVIRTDFAAADAVLQAAIDAVEVGAGLSAAGAYVADATSNYLADAESLMDADLKLDAQIKSVADAVEALGTGSLTALQTEVDAIETALGFEANGTKLDFTSVNYVGATDTVKVAVEKIDAALKAMDTAYKAADAAEVTARNTAITTAIDALTTDVVEEGTTNLYFTEARARESIDVVANDYLTYDSATGLFTLALAGVATEQYVDDAIAQEVIDRNAAIAAAVQAGTSGGAKAHYLAFNQATEAANEFVIGSVKGFVHRVKIYVDTIATADNAIQVGITGTNGDVVTTADVDSSVAGVYVVEVAKLYASATDLKLFVAGATAGKVIVEYYAN